MKTIRMYSLRRTHEVCFILHVNENFTENNLQTLERLHFSQHGLYPVSYVPAQIREGKRVVEIRPILEYASPRSSKALRQFGHIGIDGVLRCEEARRYFVDVNISTENFLETLPDFDSMQECVYEAEAIFAEEIGTSYISFPEEIKLLGIRKSDGIKNLTDLGMKQVVAEYWYDYFVNEEKRNARILEVMTPLYGYTEHSKHPHFTSIHRIDGVGHEPLMNVVKASWKINPGKSVIAFHDNASAIRGFQVPHLLPVEKNNMHPFEYLMTDMDAVMKAETHNHPTGISPKPGAETGLGGLMRDVYINGQGGFLFGSFNILGVGALDLGDYVIPGQGLNLVYPKTCARPFPILSQGSDGICDYGNPHGTPGIAGSLSSSIFILPDGKRWENLKPVVYVGGVGIMPHDNIKKSNPEPGMLIIGIGGPVYPIGFGGGLASSLAHGTQSEDKDKNSVQRGDALMARNVHDLIVSCVNLRIVSGQQIIDLANDQGAAGICNALLEAIGSVGGEVDLSKVHVGADMSNTQKWLCESQERFILIIKKQNLNALNVLGRQTGIVPEILGEIVDTGRIKMIDGVTGQTLMDMRLSAFDRAEEKVIVASRIDQSRREFVPPSDLSLKKALEITFAQLAVGSKRWIVNKMDQTVGGRTVQHQFSGPLGMTVNDCAIIKMSVHPDDYSGICLGIGYKPNTLLADAEGGSIQTIVEALSNLIAGAPSSLELSDIAFLVNEMYSTGDPDENERMYRSVKIVSEFLIACGLHINGGKDSLKMKTKVMEEFVKSLDTLAMVAYAAVPDVRSAMTPYVKNPGKSMIGLVDFAAGDISLAGSALAQAHGEIGKTYPKVDPKQFMQGLRFVMELKRRKLITACHDRVGDGLLIALTEMLVAGCSGGQTYSNRENEFLKFAFSEAPGMLVEYTEESFDEIERQVRIYGVSFNTICITDSEDTNLYVNQNASSESFTTTELLQMIERTSSEINKSKIGPALAMTEFEVLTKEKSPTPYVVPFTSYSRQRHGTDPKVAILFEEGSNGVPEMAAYLKAGGLHPHSVSMDMLRNKQATLDDFRMTAWVGGWSFGDVFGSAVGWVAGIVEHPVLFAEVTRHFARLDVMGLGVCNGNQAFSLLDRYLHFMFPSIPLDERPRLLHNISGKFEAREPTVSFLKSNSPWLVGFEGAKLPIPVAHGEGKYTFKDVQCAEKFRDKGLSPIRFVDHNGQLTETYPDNPNGSPYGFAGCVSEDGRFLGLMPHPERALSMLNFSWKEGYAKGMKVSPYIKLVENARQWLVSHM
ncbi:phosphoribosylformylglycinamidine synthase subunit PurQ [Candidatus Nomurabacteria bacterium]|nr:MAG: phosphoribosylformylglycinamidine synthase subunit PurQ [Candidatus Nomurabacteria bacterium]